MEIKSPKSNSPEIHDNTEKDLILISPSVLKNKLHQLIGIQRARAEFVVYVSLAATLLAAITTADFHDFGRVGAASIQGAFIIGLIVAFIFALRAAWTLRSDRDGNVEVTVNKLLNVEDTKQAPKHADTKAK